MPLTPRQELAIEAILSGKSMIDAAKAAGVSRATLYTWFDTEFAAELAKRKRQQRAAIDAGLHGLSEDALGVLRKAIAGRKVSKSELEAARDVLNRLERSDIRDTAMHLLDGISTPPDDTGADEL